MDNCIYIVLLNIDNEKKKFKDNKGGPIFFPLIITRKENIKMIYMRVFPINLETEIKNFWNENLLYTIVLVRPKLIT